MPIDLTDYDDAMLDALRVAILTEQERRARVAQLPDQITDMARTAVAAGVSEADVRAAIETALQEDTE